MPVGELLLQHFRIISSGDVKRLSALIDPTKVVAGGVGDPDARYLDPTILSPVTWADKVMEDEVFGPILPVLTYSSLDDALQRMSQTPRPLAGFVFSRNESTINRFINELS